MIIHMRLAATLTSNIISAGIKFTIKQKAVRSETVISILMEESFCSIVNLKYKIVLEFFAVGDKRTALLLHPVKGCVTNQYIP